MSEIEFGPYRLAGPMGPLRKNGSVVAVPPKELNVLWQLVTHAGEVVSKEALFAAVWGDTVVSEGALTVCLRRLRHVLEEDAAQPRYIATVHRLGYRFLPVATTAQPVSSFKFQVPFRLPTRMSQEKPFPPSNLEPRS